MIVTGFWGFNSLLMNLFLLPEFSDGRFGCQYYIFYRKIIVWNQLLDNLNVILDYDLNLKSDGK